MCEVDSKDKTQVHHFCRWRFCIVQFDPGTLLGEGTCSTFTEGDEAKKVARLEKWPSGSEQPIHLR